MDIDDSTHSSSDSTSSSEEDEEEEEAEEENGKHHDTQAKMNKRQSEKRSFTPPPEPLTSWPENDRSQKYLPISLEEKYQNLLARSDELADEHLQSNPLMQEEQQRIESIERTRKNIEAQNARQGGSILGKDTLSNTSTDPILDASSLIERRETLERVWMKVMVEEFGNELDALRKKEPTLGTSTTDKRMPLLIDSLQAGAELFSDGINTSPEEKRKAPELHTIDETAIFLEGMKEE